MAAPTSTQATGNPAPHAPAQARIPLYQPPKTPEEISREQERINVLLDINATLLQHISQLQGDGQGGTVGSSAAQQQQANGNNAPKMASQEYIHCMRCMQANITWLAASASSGQAANARSPQGHALMDSPIQNEKLLEKYEELKKLFPNWKGTVGARPAAMMARQNPNVQAASQSPANQPPTPPQNTPNQQPHALKQGQVQPQAQTQAQTQSQIAAFAGSPTNIQTS